MKNSLPMKVLPKLRQTVTNRLFNHLLEQVHAYYYTKQSLQQIKRANKLNTTRALAFSEPKIFIGKASSHVRQLFITIGNLKLKGF